MLTGKAPLYYGPFSRCFRTYAVWKWISCRLPLDARLVGSNNGLVGSNGEMVKSNEELVKSNEQLVERELKDRVQNSMLSTRTSSWCAVVLSSNIIIPVAASLPTTVSPNSSASQPKQKETLPGVNIDLSNLRTHLDTENSAEIKRVVQAALAAHPETKILDARRSCDLEGRSSIPYTLRHGRGGAKGTSACSVGRESSQWGKATGRGLVPR